MILPPAPLDWNEKLAEAEALIKRGWTQKAMARNEHGEPTIFSEATSFCALGAVCSTLPADPDSSHDTYQRILSALTAALPKPHTSVLKFNDDPNTKQSDVIDLFTRARHK